MLVIIIEASTVLPFLVLGSVGRGAYNTLGLHDE